MTIKVIVKKSGSVIIENTLKTASIEKFLDVTLDAYKWTLVKLVAIEKIKSAIPFFGGEKKKNEKKPDYRPEAFEAFISVEEDNELVFENTLKTSDPVVLINWIKSISGSI